VRPDVEIVAALNDEIANSEYVSLIENEHFVWNFDVFHTISSDEFINLLDDCLGTPISDAGTPERSVNATEGTLVRTSKACLELGIWLPLVYMVEAVPVMSTVKAHIEKIPRLSR